MKSVALHNLGCKVNAYEIEVMRQKLQESGFEIVPFDAIADIYIVNTCTVTNIADRKSRQMLHRAKRRNPVAVVVAVGCYVEALKGQDRIAEDVDLAIGNGQKEDIVRLLEAYLAGRDQTLQEREQEASEEDTPGSVCAGVGNRMPQTTDTVGETRQQPILGQTRAFVKVQDGCNQYCSYCIIPYVRGRVRSRQEDAVLAEVRKLAAQGYREVVLTGIHLSSYGMDFNREEAADIIENERAKGKIVFAPDRLLSLIDKTARMEGIMRVRLGSLEPRIITEEFVRRLAAIPGVCPHFHLSLQSGCNETLRRMNRHYTVEEYYQKVDLLRCFFENPAITTDVIVGFPGETAEEFAQTEDFLKKVGFYEMHVFKYSRRHNTVADRLPGQLPEEEKARRSERLLAMGAEQSRRYRASYIGKEISVLVEEKKEIDGCSWWLGHTPSYVKVAFMAQEDRKNCIVKGIANGFLREDILKI